jgi:hypothetical protein
MGRRGHHVVVGLDIGTTKICAIIGDIKSDGVVDVLGVGTHPSRGPRRVWWSISTAPSNPFARLLMMPS